MAGTFRDLKIYQKALELLRIIYRLTFEYPKEEKYGLVDQTRRSANSVLANIAESHGRYYFKDKIRVLYESRGEVEEVRSHLLVGKSLGYLPEKDFEVLDKEYEGLSKGISSFVEHFRNKK